MADGMGLPHRDASASCPIPGLRRRLEQNAPETVDPFMNRGRFAGWAMGALGAASCCSPALAKDDPGPSLSLDPIVARSLLAPVEDARNPAAATVRCTASTTSSVVRRSSLNRTSINRA